VSALNIMLLAVVSTGQQLSLKVLSVDPGRCRVALSLKQMSADPTRETMDQLVWADTTTPLPEVAPIVEVLGVMGGIEEVSVTRAAEVKHTVTQVGSVRIYAVAASFASSALAPTLTSVGWLPVVESTFASGGLGCSMAHRHVPAPASVLISLHHCST
jgi:hypothetical protein